MCEMNPYAEGQKDRRKGRRRNDNPHHMSTSAHDAWDDGWVDEDAVIAEEAMEVKVK